MAWNLFHGRDFPPDPALFTWRSRLLRVSERNDTHVQVNRDLLDEFAAMLAGGRVGRRAAAGVPAALRRAAGPRLRRPRRTGSLTSRNSLGPLRAAAARLNPDLIASGEGGSNLTLVRPDGAWARSSSGGSWSSTRASRSGGRWPSPAPPPASASPTCTRPTTIPELAAEDVLLAARRATEWAGERPAALRRRPQPAARREPRPSSTSCATASASSTPTTAPDRDRPPAGTRAGAGRRRPRPGRPSGVEIRSRAGDRAIRLSDHAPVEARFEPSV